MRAFDLVGQARVIAVVIGDIGNLGGGFTDDLAGVAGFKAGQFGRGVGHQIGEAHEEFAALGGGHGGPWARDKGAVGGIDGGAHLCFARLGHIGPG